MWRWSRAWEQQVMTMTASVLWWLAQEEDNLRWYISASRTCPWSLVVSCVIGSGNQTFNMKPLFCIRFGSTFILFRAQVQILICKYWYLDFYIWMRAMQSEQLCGCEPLLFVFDKISTSALCPDKHGPVARSPLRPITLPGCQHVSQLKSPVHGHLQIEIQIKLCSSTDRY